METLELEKEKLKQTIEIINEVLSEEKFNLQNLFDNFIGSREDLWKIADNKKIHISNLETSLDKPYFARIDFTSEDDGRTSTVYIGKNGVAKNADIVVTDWRAPISSLYYDSELGECSYESPKGIIHGNMSLKRQYEIENGELKEYFDVDLVSRDGLLQKYLNSNNDARLKTIVSTIQKEQNDVIRKKLSNNIIIQGVAGSGKTTVALHRIAYLVYNYIKTIKQSQYLVIGPNPVFLKYIKSVLPELDVNEVLQCTYEEFVKKYIEEDITINSSDKKLIDSISGKKNFDIDKFKCSIKYQKMLEEFMQMYFNSITSKPLMLGEFEILSPEVITEVFKKTESNITNNLSSRIENSIEILCRYISSNYDAIISRYGEYSYNVFSKATTETEKNKLRSAFAKDRAEISKGCRTILRKYFSKSKMDTTKFYKLFVNSINNFNIYNFDKIGELKKQTMKNIKDNSYDFEDLASLLYIKYLIGPNKKYEKLRHVVVDEAQDLGEFNFFALKSILPSATFSIFGDLAQSIYDYRGINNWNEVNQSVFGNNAEIIDFNKSYRTTAEIMNVADDIAESIGLGRSDLVIRHGEDVTISEVESDYRVPEYIANKIIEYKNKGYKTIAIISKTDLLSNYINDDLAALGIKIPNVTVSDDLSDEKFNICTISNQLSKGLEFDAVIINNASEKIYSSKESLDMKLLYVAVTRALHELDIVYSGNLTKPLVNHFKKSKDKSLVRVK